MLPAWGGQLSIVRHNLLDKQIDGAHRLLVGEPAPLKGTHEVIGAGSDIFIHVGPDRIGRSCDDAKPGASAVPTDAPWSRMASPLRLGALAYSIALTIGFPVRQACRAGVDVPSEKLV
jgi:hypothetical protein